MSEESNTNTVALELGDFVLYKGTLYEVQLGFEGRKAIGPILACPHCKYKLKKQRETPHSYSFTSVLLSTECPNCHQKCHIIGDVHYLKEELE